MEGFSLSFNTDTYISKSPYVPVTIVKSTVGDVLLDISGSEAQFISDIDVSFDLKHGDVDKLTISLVSPSGTVVELLDNSNSFANYSDGFRFTSFDDEASINIEDSTHEFNSGRFRTQDGSNDGQDLSAFDGEISAGQWKLRIVNSDNNEAAIVAAFWLNIAGAWGLCDDVATIDTLNSAIAFDTTNAPAAVPVTCDPPNLDKPVWFMLPESLIGAPCPAGVNLTVSLSSGSNTGIAVYKRNGAFPCTSNLTEIDACRGDNTVDFAPNPGEDYFVAIGSTNAGTDLIGNLTVSCLPTPQVSFVLPNIPPNPSQTVSENPTNVNIEVQMVVPAGGTIVKDVTVEVLDLLTGSATSGDYTLSPNPKTLTFSASVPDESGGAIKLVQLSIIEEGIVENDENVELILQQPMNAEVVVPSDFILQIQNDDSNDPPSSPSNPTIATETVSRIEVRWYDVQFETEYQID